MLFEENEDEKQQVSPAEEEYQQFIDDLREVAKTPAGKRVFWKLLEYTGVHISVFDKNIQEMCRNEGRREVGLWLEELLEQVDINLLYEIAKEKANVRTDR